MKRKKVIVRLFPSFSTGYCPTPCVSEDEYEMEEDEEEIVIDFKQIMKERKKENKKKIKSSEWKRTFKRREVKKIRENGIIRSFSSSSVNKKTSDYQMKGKLCYLCKGKGEDKKMRECKQCKGLGYCIVIEDDDFVLFSSDSFDYDFSSEEEDC